MKNVIITIIIVSSLQCTMSLNAQSVHTDSQCMQDSIALKQIMESYNERHKKTKYSGGEKIYYKKQNVVWEKTLPADAIRQLKRNLDSFKPNYYLGTYDTYKNIYTKIIDLGKNMVLRFVDYSGSKYDVFYSFDELKTLTASRANSQMLKDEEQDYTVQNPNGIKVFDLVEEMPQFGTYNYTAIDRQTGKTNNYSVSGEEGLNTYLSRNIKYPVVAEENKIQGTVICSVVIDVDGSTKSVIVEKKVNPSLDREAVRVLRSMPKWIPGKQNGKAVPVKLTIPIVFKLADDIFKYQYHKNDSTLFDVTETDDTSPKLHYKVMMVVAESDETKSVINFNSLLDENEILIFHNDEDRDEILEQIMKKVMMTAVASIEFSNEGTAVKVLNIEKIREEYLVRLNNYIDSRMQKCDTQTKNKLKQMKDIMNNMGNLLKTTVTESFFIEHYSEFIQSDLPQFFGMTTTTTSKDVKLTTTLQNTDTDDRYSLTQNLAVKLDKKAINSTLSNPDSNNMVSKFLGSIGTALYKGILSFLDEMDLRLNKSACVFSCGIVSDMKIVTDIKLKTVDSEESSVNIVQINLINKNW